MKNSILALSLLIFTIFIFSCSKDDTLNKQTFPRAVLNISDAKSLAVLETLQAKNQFSTQKNLYKLTVNGSFEEVKFINTDGTDIDPSLSTPVIDVNQISNLNSTYLLLSGSFSVSDTLGNNQSYTSILVRKSDGAIFNFEENDINLYRHKMGEKPFKYDSSKNIYYSNGTGVSKLKIDNHNGISKQDFLSTGQEAEYFDITPDGTGIYKYGESSGTQGNGTDDLRIRKLNGGIFEVKVAGRDNKDFWIGSNGSIYFVTYTWSNGYLPKIHKILVNNNNISVVDVWSSNNTNDYPGVGSMFRTSSQGFHKIQKENSILFIDTYFFGYSWEFFEANNLVKNIELPKVEQGSIIVNSKSYYYIASGTDLFKINLTTHEPVSLINSGEYEIYSMNVDTYDNLQFSGLRFSDGKKVFGEINKYNEFRIIDEEINREATILERLD